MTFFTIVLRSLTRRPVRTCLTLVGISIGIAAVVTLVGMASGYEKGIGKQLDAVGVDVVVSNMSGGMMPKMFDAALQEEGRGAATGCGNDDGLDADDERGGCADHDDFGARVGRIHLEPDESSRRPDAQGRLGKGGGSRHARGGVAQEKGGRHPADRGRGTAGRGDRGRSMRWWRTARFSCPCR